MVETSKSSRKNPGPLSVSAASLGAILDRSGKAATYIRERWHRTMLWRWRTGRGRPDLDTAAELHKVTRGRVRADGWTTPAAPEAQP